MKKALFIPLLLVPLVACEPLAIRPITGNRSATSSNDPMAIDLESARNRLLSSLETLSKQGDPNRYLCKVSFCGGISSTCSSLMSVSGVEDKLDYLNSTYFATAKLSSWDAALRSMRFRVTDNANDTLEGDETRDAITRDDEVIVYRPRLQGASKDGLLSLVAQHGRFVAGETGSRRAGPFAQSSDAILAAGSCLVAYTFGREGAPELTEFRPALFRESFDGETLGSRWDITGQIGIRTTPAGVRFAVRESMYYQEARAIAKNVSLGDGRIHAQGRNFGILFRQQENGMAYHFKIRWSDGNSCLYVRNLNTQDLRIVECSVPFAYSRSLEPVDVVVMAKGDRFQIFTDGSLLMDVRDSTIAGPGKVGFSVIESYEGINEFSVLE